RQPAARTGRERSAEPGARHQAAARGAAPHARATRRLLRARGAEPVRVAADGRALSREALDRKTQGPPRPHAEGDGKASRADLTSRAVAEQPAAERPSAIAYSRRHKRFRRHDAQTRPAFERLASRMQVAARSASARR